jgi:peptide/nickel transport system substrate-binding protein
MASDTEDHDGLSRRRVLQGLAAGSTISLAGCPSDGDGDGGGGDGGSGGSGSGGSGSGGSLGERVPSLTMQYWTSGLRTPELELLVPIVQENIEERLGLGVDVEPTELVSSLGQVAADERTSDIMAGYFVYTPEQLDPADDLDDYKLSNAGAGGGTNYSQYASCEYTELVDQQLRANTREQRRDLVHQAMQQMSEDRMCIPFAETVTFGLTNTDRVEMNSVGMAGNAFGNPRFYINSRPRQGDTLTAYALPGIAQNMNFPTNPLPTQLAQWTQLIHSPLLQYDENFELENCLADTFEASDQSSTFEIELHDHVFHNGDPVTAADVKFTYEHLFGNADQFPLASTLPAFDIEIVDDTSLTIDFESSAQKFVTADVPMWGILKKDLWEEAGAPDDPRGVQFDEMIGSGPFELNSFQPGSQMELTPHEHPTDEPEHRLIWRIYSSKQPAYNAFSDEQLDIFNGVPPSIFEQALDELDFAEGTNTQGIQPFQLSPQMSHGPMHFRELRDAIGKVLDRREITQVALLGEADPYMGTIPFLPNHPWFPEEGVENFTDDPTGDEEAARQVLEDAGWGWDGDGNLHYPEDADLSPAWPQGETPSPEDYPCLE